MSEIKLEESFVTFIYFFIGTCLLAIVGAWIPGLAKDAGDIMQEHIAGKTVLASSGVTLLLGYFCAIRNIARPRAYGKLIRFLIINPSNFVITLAFVAAAINWSVALSSRFLFPLVVNGAVFSALIWNALHISGIAVSLAAGAWLLHLAPADSKTTEAFATPEKTFFWVAFAGGTIVCLAFIARLATLAWGG